VWMKTASVKVFNPAASMCEVVVVAAVCVLLSRVFLSVETINIFA